MSDLERLLRASLQETGSSFEAKDTAAARQRFLQVRRRRRITGFVSGLALAGAATAAVLFVTSSE
ncbi:MAG: hypothetical protein H0U53_08165, partial [Actinobacteria bacterium]|nr:hypothetical protein [Actinomycetota bacterium]